MFRNIIVLILNYFFDFYRFFRFSSVFFNNDQNKIEGKIIYYYHTIEKGLTNDSLRLRFGEPKIKKLISLLEIWDTRNYNKNHSQFIAGCSVLCKYYEVHTEKESNISDYFTKKRYEYIKSFSNSKIGGVISNSEERYFEDVHESFDKFSNSRHSLRHFNGELIPIHKIESVINIARNAPSVCNRQSVSVKFIDNERLVKEVLRIQAGMDATADSVKQLMIVTSNLNSFVSNSERYQMYIDGGIFLQNLLYALHYYKIGACALNWSKHFFYDWKMEKLLDIKKSEKIIAIVAIGYPIEDFKVPFSKRKEINEILQIIH